MSIRRRRRRKSFNLEAAILDCSKIITEYLEYSEDFGELYAYERAIYWINKEIDYRTEKLYKDHCKL